MWSMKNVTLVGATSTSCPTPSMTADLRRNTALREMVKYCAVIELLQEMYGFQVTYRLLNEHELFTFSYFNTSLVVGDIDFFIRYLPLTKNVLSIAYPVHALEFWRIGFLLRRADFGLFQSFYSSPFSPRVWTCLAVTMTVAAAVFHVTGRWERALLGAEESSLVYEIVIAIAASCQHYLPFRARLTSRRASYTIYFFFVYLMYLFYSSNLLSHLVSDRDSKLDINALADSHYQCVVLDKFATAIATFVHQNKSTRLDYLVQRKLTPIASVSTAAALQQLLDGATAVLSDYVGLYPLINRQFSEETICQMIELDVYRNVKKYFFTSRNFTFKEHFKRGILKAKESGIIRRIVNYETPGQPVCITKHQVRMSLMHVFEPLAILGVAVFASIVVLLLEIYHHARVRVYPYTD